MGITHIINMCAHLQNSSRARVSLTSVPNSKYNLYLAIALLRQGLIASVTRGDMKPPPLDAPSMHILEPVTTHNVATRRLWIGFKFHNEKPVLTNLRALVSKHRPLTLKVPALQDVCAGRDRDNVHGLQMGECLFVFTDQGMMEAREAVSLGRGGWVVARAS